MQEGFEGENDAQKKSLAKPGPKSRKLVEKSCRFDAITPKIDLSSQFQSKYLYIYTIMQLESESDEEIPMISLPTGQSN